MAHRNTENSHAEKITPVIKTQATAGLISRVIFAHQSFVNFVSIKVCFYLPCIKRPFSTSMAISKVSAI